MDVALVEPLTEPTAAVIVTLPAFCCAVISPAALTLMTVGSLLRQVAWRVTSRVVPSENVAVAVIC